MRTIRTGFVLLTALAASAVAQTQPATRPATSRSAASIGPDADGLAAADYADRDAAQLRLLESNASPELLDALAASTTDANALARIDSLRAQLREREVISPTRITIDGDDMPVADVLAEFNRQSGTVLAFQEGQGEAAPPKVSLHLRDASFWEALRAIGEATSSGAMPDYNGGAGWMLAPHNPGVVGRNPTGAGGQEGDGFLIRATQLNYTRNVNLGSSLPSVSTQFSIQINLLAEPKFRLEGNSQFSVRRAVDSAGNNLIENVASNYGGSSGQQLTFGIPLKYPAAPGQKIREISGIFYLRVVNGVEAVRSDDLLADSPITRDVGGRRVSITATGSPGSVSLSMTIDNAAAGGAGSADVEQMFSAFQRARLVDPGGQPMRFNGYSRNNTPDGRPIATVTFARTGGVGGPIFRRVNGAVRAEPQPAADAAKPTGPISLSLDLPVSTRQIEVPFTLRDLPMP